MSIVCIIHVLRRRSTVCFPPFQIVTLSFFFKYFGCSLKSNGIISTVNTNWTWSVGLETAKEMCWTSAEWEAPLHNLQNTNTQTFTVDRYQCDSCGRSALTCMPIRKLSTRQPHVLSAMNTHQVIEFVSMFKYIINLCLINKHLYSKILFIKIQNCFYNFYGIYPYFIIFNVLGRIMNAHI